jgi:predicted NAD-dependent protein-ADP-ribosyltransferase YbiA (DUF1768 family)
MIKFRRLAGVYSTRLCCAQHRKEVRRVMLKKYGGEEKLNKVIETRLAKEKEKPSNSLFTAKSANPSVIKFSSQRGATYGCFSTFSPHPVTLKGKEWPTAVRPLLSLSLFSLFRVVSCRVVSCRVVSCRVLCACLIPLLSCRGPSQEHYFQAQKFAGMPLEELIRKAADPLRAKKMGEDKDIPPRSDWKDKQEEVMYTRPSPRTSLPQFFLSLSVPSPLVVSQVRGHAGQVHRPQGHPGDAPQHGLCRYLLPHTKR